MAPKIKWTIKKPIIEGYNWERLLIQKSTVAGITTKEYTKPEICRMVQTKDGPYAFNLRTNMFVSTKFYIRYEWFGPIKAPRM